MSFYNYDPSNPMGYIPEIPNEDMNEQSDEDIHLIGCIAPFATMVVISIGIIICVLIALIF